MCITFVLLDCSHTPCISVHTHILVGRSIHTACQVAPQNKTNMHHTNPKWRATNTDELSTWTYLHIRIMHTLTHTTPVHHTSHQHAKSSWPPHDEVWERNTLTATGQLKHHISPCIDYTIPQLAHWSFQTFLLPQATHFMRSKKFTNKKQKIFSEK